MNNFPLKNRCFWARAGLGALPVVLLVGAAVLLGLAAGTVSGGVLKKSTAIVTLALQQGFGLSTPEAGHTVEIPLEENFSASSSGDVFQYSRPTLSTQKKVLPDNIQPGFQDVRPQKYSFVYQKPVFQEKPKDNSALSLVSQSGFSKQPPKVFAALVISEVQVASRDSAHAEFVELYNPEATAQNLTGWYIHKKTKSGGSTSSYAPSSLFEGKYIPAHGFFVIAHPSSGIAYNAATDVALALDNSLVLKSPNGEIADIAGWGLASECELSCMINPANGKSMQRLFANGTIADSGNNGADFAEQDCPSPGAASVLCQAPVFANPTSSLNIAETTPHGAPTSSVAASSVQTSSGAANNTSSSTSVPSVSVRIVEVQISGGPGKTDNDAIVLANTGSQSADLSGFKLRKRTQTGSESSIKVFPSGSIVASGALFSWANSKDGFATAQHAAVSSTQTLSENNSVALFSGEGVLLGAVAWGSGHTNPFVEGTPYPQNPEGGKVLARRREGAGFLDTQNNAHDFEIR